MPLWSLIMAASSTQVTSSIQKMISSASLWGTY